MNELHYIIDNYREIRSRADEAAKKANRQPQDVCVLAVSKTHSLDKVLAAMEDGIIEFGENYVQELKEKQEQVIKGNHPQPNWHFIGHLQSNKVKYIAPFVKMIHSVDSAKLAQEIDRQAAKNDRIIDILLQVNTSGEESKSGVAPDDVFALADSIKNLKNIRVRGLMTIGTFAENKEVSIREFTMLRTLRDKLQELHPEAELTHLSMGMTNDYEIAIEQGASIVRIGTAIFGQRDYSKK